MRSAVRAVGGLGLVGLWLGSAGVALAGGLPACEALGEALQGAARVVSAQAVADGVPHCRVRGVARPTADSEIRFEVWLPERAAWTGRLKVDGTGGFAGGAPLARLAQDVAGGFVAAGSNMGHDGGESAAWTLNHPEKLKDWGVRAHAEVAAAAKTLSLAYYGEPVRHAYFEGCSNGGRQAMMMAQRYPTLFDGIVAGAPSMFYPDMLMTLLWMGRQQLPQPGQPPVLSVAKRAWLQQRVMAACDALDGLADGQITNPRACRVDPDAWHCRGDDRADCLSEAEAGVVRRMLAGPQDHAGVSRWPGPLPGAELEWAPHFADEGRYGRFVGHAVWGLDDARFDGRQLNFDADYDRVKAALTPVTAAPSPDLTAFRAHGGKLIQLHGWSDAIVTPQSSPSYVAALALFEQFKGLPAAEFERRVAALTPGRIEAALREQMATLQQSHRLFMLPGVGHCGGGSGPNAIGAGFPEPPPAWRDAQHDALRALLHWVEDGVAPERLIASRLDARGRVERQRPLCPYPLQAEYLGHGDIDAAESFRCAWPAAGLPPASEVELLQVRGALRQREVH